LVASEDTCRKAYRRKRPTGLELGETSSGGGKDIMNPTEQNGEGRKSPRKFDETYKRHAVELSLRGDRKIKEVAQELGITEWTLYRWRQQYGPRPGKTVMAAGPRTLSEAEEEVRRLRAENVRLREREIILKKSLGILSETPGSGMPKSKL